MTRKYPQTSKQFALKDREFETRKCTCSPEQLYWVGCACGREDEV